MSLGVEPPLSVAGAAAEPLDRRAVSLRWLAGTVLTGMAGAALLGGAIYSTLQGKAEIVQALRLATAQARQDDRVSNGARKGDRLTAEQETAAARQLMRVSSSTRQGDREIVRMRPFVRVSAPLARGPTEFASRVPPFDPMKTLAAASRDRAAPDPGGESEGDLSFTVSDLSGREIAPDEGPTVQPVDVRARVREAAAFEFATRFEPTQSLPAADEGALAYAAARGGVPVANVLDLRPAARNMTLVAKSPEGGDKAAAAPGESAVAVTAGGPMAAALERDANVAPQDARVIADRFAGRDGYGVASVMAGQRLKVLMGRSAAPGGARLMPVRVSLFDADGGHVGSVAMSDIGDYVAVADVGDLADEPTAEEIADEVERPGTPGRMRLYNGLYEAALKNQVPAAIVDEMVRIVSYDVDFNRPVSQGDAFEVFFSNELGSDGEVAYMALKLGGEQRRFYRFETGDDIVEFYDDVGKSAKKFLMRKPMNGGVMRSGFGFRRHPVLGYSKMHTGVDWAAPTGTPIVASGNGTVEKSGWASGYGRQVTLRHANGYETTYNHMSGIARGVSPGAQVRQGQVVGYVGSTGLSTGAHLHYEVMVNGRFVNPMTIKLPRGRELDRQELAKFAAERARIDGLLGRGPATAAKASMVGGGG